MKLKELVQILKLVKITRAFSISKDDNTMYMYPLPLISVWHNNFTKLRSFGFSLGWLFWNCTFDWTFIK